MRSSRSRNAPCRRYRASQQALLKERGSRKHAIANCERTEFDSTSLHARPSCRNCQTSSSRLAISMATHSSGRCSTPTKCPTSAEGWAC
eukprot:6180046-Pleurochrysis_carterae.AAC.2